MPRWIEISRKKSCERNPTLPVGRAGRERVPSEAYKLVSRPNIPPGSFLANSLMAVPN